MHSTADQVVRATAHEGRIRVMTCVTTKLVNELQRRHNLWPIATAALGRTASIAAMMAMNLKNEERLTIRVKGDGPLGQIMVDATPDGQVRGYVEHPHVDLPPNQAGKLNVGGGVGQGMLYITRDTGLKDYYTSSSELQTGEIGDDFTYYFAVSEQTPSAVGAGVLVNTDNTAICAGGFLIQLMPGHSEQDIEFLETQLRAMPSVTDMLKDGANAEELLFRLVPGAKVAESTDVQFFCTCSGERLGQVLSSLGSDELQSMLNEQGGAEVICHFCGEVYNYSDADLAEMLRHHQEAGEKEEDADASIERE